MKKAPAGRPGLSRVRDVRRISPRTRPSSRPRPRRLRPRLGLLLGGLGGLRLGDRGLLGLDLGAQHRRRDDVGDRIGRLAGVGAGRDLDVGDVDHVADLAAGQVDLDGVRDLVRGDVELEGVVRDVEGAAALLDARGRVLVDEVHRHGDRHGLARDDPQEVDVHRHAGDRIELEVARDGAQLAAADGDLEHGGLEPAGIDQRAGTDEVDGDGDRRLARAVDDGGNLALATNGPGGPLADPVACHGLKRLDGAHRRDPSDSWSRNAKKPPEADGSSLPGAPLPPRVSRGRAVAIHK